MTDCIDVLLATDRRCLWGCAVSMRSILDHAHPGTRIRFHVLMNGLSAQDRGALCKTVAMDAHRASIRLVAFDDAPVRGLVRSSVITPTVYARLFLAEALPEDVRRCIYVDCDLLFRRDVSELWDTDLGGYALGAVDNGLWDDPAIHQRRLGLEHPAYFNSGVMLVDVDAWRAADVGGRAVAFARDVGDRLTLFDQDALNGALDGAWLRLPEHWNLWVVHPALHEDAKAVFHFMGAHKPWHADYDGPFGDAFFDYLDRTAYRGLRPWDSGGLGRLLRATRRRIPYLPSVVRILRMRMSGTG